MGEAVTFFSTVRYPVRPAVMRQVPSARPFNLKMPLPSVEVVCVTSGFEVSCAFTVAPARMSPVLVSTRPVM